MNSAAKHGLTLASLMASLLALSPGPAARAQPVVGTTPSRQTIEEAARVDCDGVSVIVQRCATRSDDATKKPADALTRSRAATKAAFDRRDSRGRAAAMDGSRPASAPVGEVERLGGVTVTGNAPDRQLSVEEVLQRALAPPTVSADGTVSHYGPNGERYDCIQKCIGPACCATIRSLPNPARDSNSIGR